jgi:two-component system nitrate/nitrite sensor histidine kinase NarX
VSDLSFLRKRGMRSVPGEDAEPSRLEATDRVAAGRDSQANYGQEFKALLDGFLETIIKSAGASGGAIRMLSSDGLELHIAGAVGLPKEIQEGEGHVDLGCGVCGQAAREGSLQTTKAATCARLSGIGFFGSGCKGVVAVPLEFRGKRIGVFNLFFDEERELGEEAAHTLRCFAEMIGISLENARLARENRRMQLMAERQAIANEIHDSLAQTLTFGRMRMTVLKEALRRQDADLAQKCVNDVNEALDSGKKSVRELITHFRCQMDPLGLRHALQVLAGDFVERTGIELEYTNTQADFLMPMEHELQVFNIVREVLANIATHSGASRASLRVSRERGRYVFAIEDNGTGMPGSIPPEGHYGLTIMRERARRIGAQIEVDSAKGEGTRVRLILLAS